MTPRAREVVLVAVALAVGLLVYWPTTWLLPSSEATFSFGTEYQKLSADPFAFGSQLPHRILAPLLAWLLGLGGAGYPRFAQLCSALLLGGVFWFCRRRGARAADAVLIALAVAFSGTTQTYKLLTGFADPLSFLLLLLAVAAVRSGVAFWTVNLLSLLNHEMLLFFLPWLCWERRRAGAGWRADLLGAGVVCGLYVAFRWFVAAHAQQQELTAGWYTGRSLLPLGTLWLWILTFVYWVVDFGPLLVLIAWGMRAAPRGDNLSLLLFLACLFAIYALVYVYDFARFGSFLFLPLVLASLRFLQDGRRRLLYAGIVAAAIASFLCWHPDAPRLEGRPGGYALIGDIDRITFDCRAYADHGRLFTCVLPQIWPLLVGLLAELVAFAVFGCWLARGRAHAAAAPATARGEA